VDTHSEHRQRVDSVTATPGTAWSATPDTDSGREKRADPSPLASLTAGPAPSDTDSDRTQRAARVDQHEALMTARAAPSDIKPDFNQRATPVTAMPTPLVRTGPQSESLSVTAPLGPAATGEVPLAPSNTSNTFSSFFQL
jgi:hypothetical protein